MIGRVVSDPHTYVGAALMLAILWALQQFRMRAATKS
jgi:hypothetical protein